MPSPDFTKKDNGRYATDGLSSPDFLKLFNKIRKAQRNNRRGAHRTLTPARMRNKELDEFLKLGKKKDGKFFTPEDMKQFIQQRLEHRKHYNSNEAGITYAQLVAESLGIDVKRANNKVDDGTGISQAMFIRLQSNTAFIKVTASASSMDDNHLVRVRFEEWDQYVESVGDEKSSLANIAKKLAASRVSFDCDCGRHQYWYRYMATAGNYALKPPAEYAFPKIRNPDLTGVACKHVIHTMTRFQSSTWHRHLGNELKKAASRVAFGDDKKRNTKTFTEKEQKELARNRTHQTDQKKVAAEYERYQTAQQAMAKKQASGKEQIEKLRQQATRSRNSAKRKAAALKLKQAENNQLKLERDAARQLLTDQLKMKKQTFIDAMKIAGKTQAEAEKAFNDWLKSKMGNK